jgi:hypothetical protein
MICCDLTAIANRAGLTGFGVPIREWLMSSVGGAERGLRGWAREVYTRWCAAHNCPMIIDVAKA